MSLQLTVVKRIELGIGSCRLKCLGYLIRLSHKTYSAKRELLDGSNQLLEVCEQGAQTVLKTVPPQG